jgi:chromosome segregation ATPase
MNIDNSGATVVLDSKSKEAIESVANRITVMESEVARLTKLRASLEGDVRKLEGEIAYKNEMLNTYEDAAEATRNKLTDLEEDVRAHVNTMHANESDLKARENALAQRENEVTKREQDVSNLAVTIANEKRQCELDRAEMDEEIEVLELKKRIIQDALTKL